MDDTTTANSLPDDPALLKQMIAALAQQRDVATRQRDQAQRQHDELHVKFLRVEMELLRLKKWYYGPRADRLQQLGDVAQLLLEFAEELEASPVNAEDLPADIPVAEVRSVRRVRRGRGRRNLAAFDQLPLIRREHDLSDDQKLCPCCGEMRQRIGSESSWQIEYIPGHFERLEHVRIKYACPACEQNAENPQIELADKPMQAIEKGMAGPGHRSKVGYFHQGLSVLDD